MKITVTPKEIMDKYAWDDFCSDRGYDPWCVNSGLMPSDEEIKLTEEEAVKYGFITKENEY